MADRFRRFARGDTPPATGNGGTVATDEQGYANDANGTGTADAPPPPPPETQGDRRRTAVLPRTGDDDVVLDRDARLRQREEFGGINWGAAFFGWVVALGIGVLLTAIVVAAGAAVGLTDAAKAQANSANLDTLDIVGGALLIAISMLAYYAGGYVAGRMSRFDGARQGFGVWLFGVLVTLVVAAAGAILGDQYNVFDPLHLPRIPSNAGDLTTGGVVALAAIVLGSLLAAVVGGKVGQRYHRRVDRAAALVD
jgi:hypothetical protein